MKKTLLAATLALSAFTAGATTVGLDYSHSRVDGRPTLDVHGLVGSIKQPLGNWGSVKLVAGGIQVASARRDNGYIVGAEYSYDFTTPAGRLSPSLSVQRAGGTAGGSSDTATVGALLRTPLVEGLRLVTGAGYTRGINGTTAEATSIGVGAEVDLTKSLMLKAGYTYERLSTVNRRAGGLGAGVEFKF